MAREYKDSGIEWIGQIPKEWSVELIGNNIKEINDKNDDSSEDNALQFKMGSIISKKGGDSKYNPESLAAYTKVKEGDIVINGLNLSFDFISQRVGLVREKGVITSTYLTLRPSSLLHSVFVNYLFKAYDNCKAFHGMGRGLRQILAYRELKNQKLIYPPLPEQQKIADYLDKVCGEVDEMVTLQETMIEELKAYKQSVITEAVTKGLNPDVPMKDSGIDWIGEIPEHWEVQPFKWILRKPLQYGANESGVLYDDSLPRYVRITDILNNSLREDLQKQSLTDEQAEGYILEDDDILFARSGGTVGKAFIYKKEYGRCAFAGYLIRAQIKAHCCPNYVYYYTQSQSYDEWKRQIFIQATIQNIGADRYSLMELPVPPLSEQRTIASYLDTKCSEIDALIALKQAKIDELKEYKKSVIYEYVTGKKEVC